ncbi:MULTISPECIES: c-type cytochrome [unclassified Halomonas]|uniref:c-type cytochrome n=1 Tax=unclassified Halomonas TaxID=2609666 RepID=UPI0021E418B7|nr:MULTISPECIES: c-type cytochrome [unclassified Halomonas]UYF99923.1 c-type cytochrome [Halomonas sp. GD1P12]WNL38989.1 c-type cytochrome [Halomonas sp. PAMB 3232]WNL42328.1 c-type cytochrome [Halomonas sp. PAMB 3264]
MSVRRVAAVVFGVLSSVAVAGETGEGEAVYDRLCMACHQTGVAGAPIRGESDHWTARLEQDVETLVQHAIDGIGAMPPRGGNPNLTDDEIRAATHYLIEPVMATPAEKSEAFDESVEGETPLPVADDAESDTESEGSSVDHRRLDGEALYVRARCATCHATGIARSPKLGDASAWRERLAQGRETLYQSVILGKGVMPPRGASTASDDELKAMVDYMIERVR